MNTPVATLKLVVLLFAATLLASCASPSRDSGRTAPPAPGSPGSGAPTTRQMPPSGTSSTPPSKGSGTAPIPDRTITLAGACKQTEEDGFREEATLSVQNNQVQALDWQLWVGKRGSCKFTGTDFTQRQSRPHIELIAKDGSGCKLMIWQDPRRVTLEHNGCQKHCTKGIYDEAWPVMFDPSSGACAKG